MKLDEVRAELYAISRRIAELAAELHKRKPIKKAPPKKHMTPALKRRIRQYWRNGHMSQRDIAEFLNINQGRVSEVIRGKRT